MKFSEDDYIFKSLKFIIKIINFRFISSFNRPNLRYSVIPKKTRVACQQIIDIIKSKFPNECGIIYCISRKDCDDQANALLSKGIEALSYHAGLEDKVRVERQSQWISEKVIKFIISFVISDLVMYVYKIHICILKTFSW
jgi:superfamily II DNA helicase RecQ